MTTRLDDIRDTLSDKKAEAADAWGDLSAGTRRAMVVGAVVIGALVVGLIVWAVWPNAGEPALDDPRRVAEFVHSDAFKELSADGRRPYMKAARKQQQAIADLRRAGKIDRRTYRAAYLAAWLERRVEDMEAYYDQPSAKRAAFLDEMLGHPQPKPAGKSTGAAGVAAKPAAPQPATKPKPKDGGDTSLLYDNDEADRKEFEAMKDRFEDDFLDAWPKSRKEQYKQFRSAYTQRRSELESTAPPATAPSAGKR